MTQQHTKLHITLSPEEERLNQILNRICQGVDVPQVRQESGENEAERLMELIESKNYPYDMLRCQHLEEKGIGEDCVACQQLQYETYKSRFLSLIHEKGYEHVHTLKAAFDYYGSLIAQYRLTECDELLDKIYPYCISRGSWSSYYISAIQALAFLRFKQGKYKDSVDYFKNQIDIQGPNEMIYENMALAYTRLGNYKEASLCYARALLLIRQQSSDKQKMSTLLMGLSLVLDEVDDAFIVLKESMKLLQQRFDKPHSLMAKTLGAMGDLHMKRQDFLAAEDCYHQAVRIFIDTCGYETPLTANTMGKHAKMLLQLGHKEKAILEFIQSLKVWVRVDNESFDPNSVVEALLALRNEFHEISRDKIPAELITVIELLEKKITNNAVLASDLNILCLLKFMTELYIFLGEMLHATGCSRSFRDALLKLDNSTLGDLTPYRDKLLQETTELLTLLESLPQ